MPRYGLKRLLNPGLAKGSWSLHPSCDYRSPSRIWRLTMHSRGLQLVAVYVTRLLQTLLKCKLSLVISGYHFARLISISGPLVLVRGRRLIVRCSSWPRWCTWCSPRWQNGFVGRHRSWPWAAAAASLAVYAGSFGSLHSSALAGLDHAVPCCGSWARRRPWLRGGDHWVTATSIWKDVGASLRLLRLRSLPILVWCG